jgi:hypothetical protein
MLEPDDMSVVAPNTRAESFLSTGRERRRGVGGGSPKVNQWLDLRFGLPPVLGLGLRDLVWQPCKFELLPREIKILGRHLRIPPKIPRVSHSSVQRPISGEDQRAAINLTWILYGTISSLMPPASSTARGVAAAVSAILHAVTMAAAQQSRNTTKIENDIEWENRKAK